jgi:hypothetical protein
MVKPGDQIEHYVSGARVIEVKPYCGRYPQWFNVVLVLSSTQTSSGRIERAYNDRALRPE